MRMAGADRKHLNCALELINPGTAIPLDFFFYNKFLVLFSLPFVYFVVCVCAQLCLTLCDPMSGSVCWFLTCIQISQEAGQVVVFPSL